MKLSLLTYNIARDWDLGKLIEVCKNLGFAGIEFRVEREHKHGIELDMDKKPGKKQRKGYRRRTSKSSGLEHPASSNTAIRRKGERTSRRQRNISNWHRTWKQNL